MELRATLHVDVGLQGRRVQIHRAKDALPMPITINEVSNLTNVSQAISNRTARIAASSIVLTGRWTGEPDNQNWTQYQYYPFG